MGINYVNNISVDHTTTGNTVALPEITTQYYTGSATTPKELYRCSDNKIFTPLLIVATNLDSTDYQHIRLVDADITDAGDEDNNKADTKDIYMFTVAPDDSTILNEKDLLGLKFRYGVCAYNSVTKTAGSGVKVYIAGVED